jgi:hypothetical protein
MSLPRVSTILQDLGFGTHRGTAYHLARGTALHRAIQLDLAGTLDATTVHPDIAPGFTAWAQFRRTVKPEVLQAECELHCAIWRFCGHPDLIATVDGLTTLYDYKYTDSVDLFWARHQLSAYKHLWDVTHPTQPVTRTAVLQLSPSGGGFRLHPIPPLALGEAQQNFYAACRTWHVLQERVRA